MDEASTNKHLLWHSSKALYKSTRFHLLESDDDDNGDDLKVMLTWNDQFQLIKKAAESTTASTLNCIRIKHQILRPNPTNKARFLDS